MSLISRTSFRLSGALEGDDADPDDAVRDD